uniref:mitogen-activated protein kinase kinase n=1 Tax=Panagrellus redivivus TaxID=6233 RepID=A0A7E4V5V1_PANRE
MSQRGKLSLDFSEIESPSTTPTTESPRRNSQITQSKLIFPDGVSYDNFTTDNLIERGMIGSGSFGSVLRMEHIESHKIMAVKRVRAHDIKRSEKERVLRELKITIETQQCEDVVRFYGAVFQDGDCWICMEIMDCSIESLYKAVYKQGSRLPENVISFIAVSVVRALNYLKKQHRITHRDVKPSNILMNSKGFVKLCDFGISGYLYDSIARTQDVGCQIYLAPERLRGGTYGIKADVWSFGLSLVEICLGRFPYPPWASVFEQMQSVVNGDPPILHIDDGYSYELANFVNLCLVKEEAGRPTFEHLTTEPFYIQHNIVNQEEMDAKRAEIGKYVVTYVNAEPTEA